MNRLMDSPVPVGSQGYATAAGQVTALYQAHATGLVRPLHLRLAADLAESPAKPHRPGLLDRWRGALIPITAAAAAVVAVAATLLAVRGVSATGGAPHPAPASSGGAAPASGSGSGSGSASANRLPAYYVTLNSVPGTPAMDAVLGQTRTGKALATFKPPANGSWQGVATSAGDRTFVLYGVIESPKTHQPESEFLYALRIPSGGPQQARLAQHAHQDHDRLRRHDADQVPPAAHHPDGGRQRPRRLRRLLTPATRTDGRQPLAASGM